MLRTYLVIFSFLFLLPNAHAQVIKAEKSNNYKAVISNYDSNHISVAGGFIVSAVAPEDGRVIMDKDEATGSFFLRLNKGIGDNSKPFTIFIRDSNKNSYTLLVSPANVPGNNIILQPIVNNTKEMVAGKSLRRNEVITFIMEHMILNKPMKRCRTDSSRKLIKLWKGTKFYQVKRYQCGRYIGRVFSLTNISNKPIRIVEQEFYKMGTVAVSISKEGLEAPKLLQVQAKETADVFVIEEVSRGS